MTTTTATRKPRTKKQITVSDLMALITPQSLATKVELYGLLKQSIDDDRKLLEEQLSLLKGI